MILLSVLKVCIRKCEFGQAQVQIDRRTLNIHSRAERMAARTAVGNKLYCVPKQF